VPVRLGALPDGLARERDVEASSDCAVAVPLPRVVRLPRLETGVWRLVEEAPVVLSVG
jgi:hypothetical protein